MLSCRRSAGRGHAATSAAPAWALLAMLLTSQALVLVAHANQNNNNNNQNNNNNDNRNNNNYANMNNFDHFGKPDNMVANYGNNNNNNNNNNWGGLPSHFSNDTTWAMYQLNPFQGPAHTGNPARDDAAEQAKLQAVQAALKGDPSVAAVVAPSLLLSSAILLTVSPSLATASTGVGIASALIGNIAAWTLWMNDAAIFFTTLGDNRRRNLLATDGTDGLDSGGANDTETQLFRSQLLDQMRSATTQMRDWGGRVGTLRKSLQQGPFQQYLSDQRGALKTARDAITAVQNTNLGKALGLQGVGLQGFNGNQWLTQLRDAAQSAGVGTGGALGGGGAAGANFMQRMAEMMGKAFQG
ncbi:hypothetical protein CHLRE_09g399950v5 [Chlamydomonas reinhardtii]|uniref:Uncharacterized protein n=1 Tax=Chlamydomonas reinhardtii TaxID=3055 RepID=A0A2K3DCW3_CHLRE|nr:uncharacterized protein CHLRE_09g399950v5 [Chlamydomonas reinhardtii]PNW78370.1 hypothetical protein CHLRE_09g399950v5 [Chlamydomonas reinhardtii]